MEHKYELAGEPTPAVTAAEVCFWSADPKTAQLGPGCAAPTAEGLQFKFCPMCGKPIKIVELGAGHAH